MARGNTQTPLAMLAGAIVRDEDWYELAKCKGTDNPERWDTSSLSRNAQKKNRQSMELCAGCPVMAECARENEYYRSTGVVAAGIALTDNQSYNEMNGQYENLRRISRGEQPVFDGDGPGGFDLNQDSRIETLPEHLMATAPGTRDPHTFFLDGFEYCSRTGAKEILGISDRSINAHIASGRLNLTRRYIRRTARGQATVFFLVDELHAAKEKLNGL